MSVPNGELLVTKQDLADMYQGILPYLGGMPEVLANKFSKGDMYSTDEKMIGQWYDGKPLYQKTVNFGTLPNKSTTDVPHNISDIDVIVSVTGIAYDSGKAFFYPLPYTSPDSVGDNILLIATPTYVRVMTGYNRSNLTNCYIILQYTKTTDSPISIGDETDYSTEEKIVGTWIDGKPIFQRTVQMTLPAKDSDTTLNVSSWNINLVVSCQGTSASMQSAPMTTYVGNSNYHYHCFVNMPNKLLYVRNLGSTLGVGDVGYVTVQYTKTT